MEKKQHKVSAKKLQNVKVIAGLMDKNSSTLIASTVGLSSAQLQRSRKLLRDKAIIKFAKKSTVLKSIETSKRDGIQKLMEFVGESPAIIFTNEDPFDIATILADNKFPAKAKGGQIAPVDISVEAGPTDLLPGPVISEFANVGIKAGIVGGKIAIKEGKVVAKAGEKISPAVASILMKLEITPFEVGLNATVAYDGKDSKVYSNIKIDKAGSLARLKEAFATARQFAINIAYPAADVIDQIIVRAEREALALEKMLTANKSEGTN